jgi:hypothetical protein
MSTNPYSNSTLRSDSRTSKSALPDALILVILAPFILLITSAFSWHPLQPDITGIQLPPVVFPHEDAGHIPQPITNDNSGQDAANHSLRPANMGVPPESFVQPESDPVDGSMSGESAANVVADDPATPLTSADIEHVVIISMDGVRPDAITAAETPTLDRLIAKGAYSPQAQTIDPSYTLPAHTSMLSGVVPEKHGIVEALPCIGCPLSLHPTIFSVAHEADLSTGMVFGKEKLNYIALPHTVDELFGVDAYDPEVLDESLAVIREAMPNVLFIHLPDPDRVGHEYGWMSTNYLYSIGHVDSSIGEIADALDGEGYLDTTLLIITSDHGGHEYRHGLNCSEDMTIPWLAVGPGVPQGVTLSSHINIYDTTATAAYAFNLPIPERWDGRPVMEIFDDQQVDR